MADLRKLTDLLRGPKYRMYIIWRAEEADGPAAVQAVTGFFGGNQIDLDIIGMGANSQKKFIGACHAKDKKPFDGAMRFGGNTKAKAGQAANEFIDFDLDTLIADGDVSDVIFGATCPSNPLAMSNLAELRFRIVRFEGDSEVDVLKGRRSIETQATAALFARINLSPAGASFTEIDDTYNVASLRDAKKWRNVLLDQARSALR